jgi:hypothetical protein
MRLSGTLSFGRDQRRGRQQDQRQDRDQVLDHQPADGDAAALGIEHVAILERRAP